MKKSSNNNGERGVTLIEMLVVVVIIAVLVGIVFPSAMSGLDSIRLASTSDNVAAFLSAAVNRSERRQQMLELTVSKAENAIILRAVPNYEKRIELPQGIFISAILPDVPTDPDLPRHFLLYPGGAPPRVGVRLANRKGGQRIVSLDPVTGVPVIERLANAQ